MTPILAFYLGTGANDEGVTFQDMLEADDTDLEHSHTFIQWLFPLPERSHMQPSAPVLTAEDEVEFITNEELRKRLLQALDLMVGFYERTAFWTRAHDHNHLRITRIIRSLTLLGLPEKAKEFHDWVQKTAPERIPGRTRWYWSEALNRHPAWLAQGSAS